ncbi:MAG: hypothetical protein OHK0013_34530 [Sandaracinaceae bacterium]
MRATSHISVARSKVREGEITRHLGAKLEGGRVFLVVSGLGLPRTWPLALGAVVRGFELGLAEAQGGRAKAERLVMAADRVRRELSETCERLVERTLPDAAFAAVAIDGGDLHVVSAGPCRVYLHRSGKPQRLTPREEPKEGALRARVTQCSTPLEPGDLVMAGSVSAFSVRSIAQVVTVLQDDPRTEPPILASLLTEPAAQAGVGAAAVVLRIA